VTMKSGGKRTKCKVWGKDVCGMLQLGNERDRASQCISFPYNGRGGDCIWNDGEKHGALLREAKRTNVIHR
jgi:hypothetical protein